VAALALALAAPAAACTKHASQGRLETLLVCPSCHTTLDESDSEVAREMKAEVKQRIAACQSEKQILDAMVAEFGPARQAVVARELTKVHESLYRGTLEELVTVSQRDENFARGEITLVVQGAPRGEEQSVDPALLLRTVDILLKELPPPRAAAVAAQLTGATRAAAYAMATRKKTDEG